ncbi:MAG: hypothetical protein IID46_16105 [Planctomycetes bacterium]|nr:hypothetical protein [Planctomycetota bacterium]
MRIHRFSLILADLSEMTEEMANALYKSGCDDGSPGSSCGLAQVAFDREADSLEGAIRSAVSDVRKAGFSVERVQIDDEALTELVDTSA